MASLSGEDKEVLLTELVGTCLEIDQSTSVESDGFEMFVGKPEPCIWGILQLSTTLHSACNHNYNFRVS